MNENQKFHLRRLEDILQKGKAETPMSEECLTGKIFLSTTEDKLLKILSSLFEMGLIESYEAYQQIQKATIKFFQPPRCQTCSQVLP